MLGALSMSASPPLLIVHVVHHLVIGGMENGMVNLINRLPHDRFRHVVVCIEDSSDFARRIERADVEVISLHRSKVGIWKMRWRLFRLLQRLRPNIVHSRNLSGLDALLPARLSGIVSGLRTLHSEHGFDVADLRGAATKPALLRRLHAPLVHRYVCVSQDLGRLMVEQWGLSAGRVRQIYNGVDTDRFVPTQPRPQALLPAELLGDGLFIIGAVGRVRPIKDQATLLRAFARLLDRRPDWRARLRLALIGDGPQLPELQALAASLGISAQCWFSGARDDVAALMQSLDLFVLPSLNEGISNTLLEAMSTGLPVVATAVGGNVELMDEGVIGASFAPGDHSHLAAIIESYVADASLCLRHGAAARERAVNHFSLQAMVANYQEVYESL